MSHELSLGLSPVEGNQIEILGGGIFYGGPPAILACGGILSETDHVVTSEAFEAAVPTSVTNAIYASDTDQPCPRKLRAESCDNSPTYLPVVLGSNGSDQANPIWGRPARSPLRRVTFTGANPAINVSQGDVFQYIGIAGDLIKELNDIVGSCFNNDVWIKNSSNFNLTVQSSSTDIDGADITLLPNEFAHLMWTSVNWIRIG